MLTTQNDALSLEFCKHLSKYVRILIKDSVRHEGCELACRVKTKHTHSHTLHSTSSSKKSKQTLALAVNPMSISPNPCFQALDLFEVSKEKAFKLT